MKKFFTTALVIALVGSALAADPSAQPRIRRETLMRKVSSDQMRAAEALFVRSSVDEAKRFAALALKRDAALRTGYVTGEQFDQWVVPEEMVGR